MDIQEIIDTLDNTNFRNSSYSYGEINTPFEIKPNDFLDFAENDIISNYSHKEINALSNAKRALDCQLDSLLFAFGLYKKAQKEKWNFPIKLKIINELGILAPNVLARINKKRNLLEHEFVKPNTEQISDFIDIVSLFLEATNRFLFNLIDSYSFQLVKYDEFDSCTYNSDGNILLEDEKIKVELTKYINNKPQEKEELIIDCNDSNYVKLLRKFIEKAMRY